MLSYDNNPIYILYGQSYNEDKLIGMLSLQAPNKQKADYLIKLKLDNADLLENEDEQVLAQDIITFIKEAKSLITKADS